LKNFLFAILFLLSFGMPFSGTCYFLKQQKRMVKKEIKKQIIAGIDKNELVCLIFANTEVQTGLRWEHAKEFEFNGEMYDVVESETIGDSTHFWCWWDHEETKLNIRLRRLVADHINSDPLSKRRQERLDNFLKSLFAEGSFQWLTSPDPLPEFHMRPVSYYLSICISPASPPPKMT
jgi:hypothetical protein